MDNQITAQPKWIESLWTSLLHHHFSSASISVVPENLRKWKEDAYMPKVVSIGPRFKATKEEFLLMDEVKLSCMSSLLSRAAAGGPLNRPLLISGNAVCDLEQQFRKSYITDIKHGKEELAKILLVDGCFLLELLITKGLDSTLPSDICSGIAAQVLKDEVVLSDLMLFENQIPIVVLLTLATLLFPEVFPPDDENTSVRKKISNLALSVLGYSPLQFPCPKANHILDVVHFYVNRTDYVVVDITADNTTQTRQQQQLKLKRCALRLLTSGITIKVKLPQDRKTTDSGTLSCFSSVWNGLCAILFWLFSIFLVKGKHMKMDDDDYIHELKGLDFWFKFENGKLEIGQLHITNTTKAKWCNVIALEHSEHHRSIKTSTKGRPLKGFPLRGDRHGGGGKFTLAALIFNSLICSEDDVQLLKDKKIVVDHLKMTNQELMDFFRKIELGIDHGVVNSSNYIQMVDDINNFSKAFLIKRICSTVLNSFRYRQEWLFRFLNRNYNFVATVVSILTVVQTVYSILAYYFPK